jgi:hypothetical protein
MTAQLMVNLNQFGVEFLPSERPASPPQDDSVRGFPQPVKTALRAFGAEGETHFTGHTLNMAPPLVELLRGLQVFQHQGNIPL